MPQKLETTRIYWLTFARIVNGIIPLTATGLRKILEKPAPPYSYQDLEKAWTVNLAAENKTTRFIDDFRMGPDKKQLPEWRRQELKLMYYSHLNDPDMYVYNTIPKRVRYTCKKFHVPIKFHGIFRIKDELEFLVKYLFAYYDKEYIASREEMDVLIVLASNVFNRKFKIEAANHFEDGNILAKIDSYDYRTVKFLTEEFGFYEVDPDRIESIKSSITRASDRLDILLDKIEESNSKIDEDLAASTV